MSAGVRLFGQGGMYTAGLFLMRAGNFLLLPLYTALLSTEQYGAVGVVQQLVGVVVVLSVAAQGHAVLRLGVDAEADPARLGRLVSTLAVYVGAGGVLLTGVALALWPLYRPLMGDQALWPVGIAGLVGVTGQALFQLSLAYQQLRGRAKVHTSLNIQRWLVLLAGVLLFVLGMRWGPAGLLLAMSLSYTVGAALALRRVDGLRPAVHGGDLGAGLTYGLPLIPHLLSGVIIQATDRALLASGPGLDQVGLYTLAANLSSAVFMVAMGMQRAWVPFLLRLDRDRVADGWERARKLSFFALAMVASAAVGVGLFAPEIVALIGRKAYVEASAVLPVLVMTAFIRAYYLQSVAVVVANKRTARWLALITVPAALLNVVLNLELIPVYGMMGAAFATLGAHTVEAALATGLGRIARPVPFKYVRGLVLLVLVGAALWFGHDAALPLRLGLAAGFVAALLVLDGRDILGAARSVWRQIRDRRPSSGVDPER